MSTQRFTRSTILGWWPEGGGGIGGMGEGGGRMAGRMADRNRELVPNNWSLVRERALTTLRTLFGRMVF